MLVQEIGLYIVHIKNRMGTYLARCQLIQTKNRNLVEGSDLVIVSCVGECQGQHTLLLQVSFVDTGEGLDNDGNTTKMTGLKSGMLARAALT